MSSVPLCQSNRGKKALDLPEESGIKGGCGEAKNPGAKGQRVLRSAHGTKSSEVTGDNVPTRSGSPARVLVEFLQETECPASICLSLSSHQQFQNSPEWISYRSFGQLSSGDASTQLKWCATLTSQWHRWSSWTPPWKMRGYDTARTGPPGRSLATQRRMTNIWQLWTTSTPPLRSKSVRRRCTARSVRSGITPQSSARKIQSTAPAQTAHQKEDRKQQETMKKTWTKMGWKVLFEMVVYLGVWVTSAHTPSVRTRYLG